jgi:hypothetical protein
MLFADGASGTDGLIIAVVNIIVGAILAGFLAWIKRGQTDASKDATDAIKEAKADRVQVKQALEVHTTSQNEKLDTIHTLVNSALGVRMNAEATAKEALAQVVPTPENILAAEAARDEYHAHMAKQATVDAATTTGRATVADAKKANDSNTMGS